MGLDLRARFDLGSKSRRYAGEDAREPREVVDPHTLRDETAPTWRDRFWQFRWYVLTTSAFVVILVLYLAAVGSQIFVDLLGNPFAQLGLWTLFVAGTTYVVATKRAINAIQRVDWLSLIKPDGLELWPGEYVAPAEGENYQKFVPYRGFTLLGHLSNPMTIADVSPDLARRWKNANRDPDDPAVIRLDPDMGEHAFTDYGHVLAQLSSGLQVDTFGQHSVLEARLPDMADEGRMEDLREQLEDERETKRHYEGKAETFRQQRDNVLREARRPLDELVDEDIERGIKIAEAGKPRYRSLEDEEEDVPPIDRDLEDVGGGES